MSRLSLGIQGCDKAIGLDYACVFGLLRFVCSRFLARMTVVLDCVCGRVLQRILSCCCDLVFGTLIGSYCKVLSNYTIMLISFVQHPVNYPTLLTFWLDMWVSMPDDLSVSRRLCSFWICPFWLGLCHSKLSELTLRCRLLMLLSIKL